MNAGDWFVNKIDITLLPTVDGWTHQWDVERDGPAVLTFDPPYTDERGEVWTKALYWAWGEYRNISEQT